MQGKDVLDALKKIGVTHLYHANSVTTSCTFLERGGLLSRGFVEHNGLKQTLQTPDEDDKKFGVWDRIFLDQVDIHERAGKKKAPNQYGPVLFPLDLDILLRLPVGSDVLVTKENPIYWEGRAEADRCFQNAEDLEKHIQKGEFAQMIMIHTPL